MRSDIVPGTVFLDYDLPDHTTRIARAGPNGSGPQPRRLCPKGRRMATRIRGGVADVRLHGEFRYSVPWEFADREVAVIRSIPSLAHIYSIEVADRGAGGSDGTIAFPQCGSAARHHVAA